jgi:hypothetical protein
MGVDLHEVGEPLNGDFEELTSIRFPRGRVQTSGAGFLLDCSTNDSFAAVSRLLRRGIGVHRIHEPVETEEKIFPKGSFYVPPAEGVEGELEKLSKRLHVKFLAAPEEEFAHEAVGMLKIGMYQRFWGGSGAGISTRAGPGGSWSATGSGIRPSGTPT